MPKVSVIMSSYNHEKYLAAAIQSVLEQTFGDFELLIFDDGSADGSREIIRGFDDARIKTFLYEENRGPFYAIQEPLKNARGEYLAFQHSDDIWEPDKLAAQVEFLDKNPQYAACFTRVKFIDERGEPYDLPDSHPYRQVFKRSNRSREEWLNYLFWRSNCFCNPSVLFRNERQNLALNSCLWQLPDYFMWLNLCKRANVYILERELIRFRLRREVQNSVSSLSLEKSIRGANEIYFTAREFLSLTADAEEFLRIFPEAREYLVDGQIVTKFAFAQLCLKHQLPAYQKLGLEILYELLQDAAAAESIKKIYGYDEKNFVGDTGTYDVFGMRFQVPLLHCRIYMDFGAGLNEHDSVEIPTLIRPDGDFLVELDYPIKNKIRALRFDPDNIGVLILKLEKITVNGRQITDYYSNAQKIIEGYHFFMNIDPWFMINCETETELRVEIRGKVNQNPLPQLEKLYSDAVAHANRGIFGVNWLKIAGKLDSIKVFVKKILG